MKPQSTLLSALLIALTFISCSKNNDHPAEGSVLKSYTTTFRDSIVFYLLYDRDANNRIISMRDSTKAYEFKTNLVYGSNGKVEKMDYFQQGALVSSVEFTYNAEGRISKRKVRSGTVSTNENYNVYVYDAAGHMVTDSSFWTKDNSTYYIEMISNFQYTGDNITEAEEYTVTNGTLGLHTHIKYEYDNGANPFKDMEYEYFFDEAGSAIYTIQLRSSNNPLKAYTANSNGGWDLMTNSTYQYNSHNFLSKANTTNVNSTTQNAVTEYFYQ